MTDIQTDYQGIPLTIDRPRGFVQEGTDEKGALWRRVYRYDYGFIPKTEGGDDEDTDVFLGPNRETLTSWWAVQTKADGTFDEFKVFLGFSTLALARGCYKLHIPARFCAGFFAVPIAMIKSLLGLHPGPVIEALMKRMRNRVQKLEGVSFDQLASLLSDALRTAYPSGDGTDPYCGPYPIEVYDDSVVYSHAGKLWKDAFTYANGAVTLSGTPISVVRTYVPANASNGDVTMNKQANGVSKILSIVVGRLTKANATAGASDIVSLASERLTLVAGELGKGDGLITPEIAAELDAVGSLIDTARQLYSGSAPADDPNAGDPSADLAMAADLDKAAKSGGTVRMTPEALIAYASKRVAKVKTIADPVLRARKTAQLETMLMAGLALASKAEGDTIDVMIVPEEDGTEVTNENIPGVQVQDVPADIGVPATAAEKLAKSTSKIADLRKKLAPVVAPGAPVKKNDEAPPEDDEEKKKREAAEAQKAVEADFTDEQIDALPDTSFAHIDDGAAKDASGRTEKSARHFPVRDAQGRISKVMVTKAIASLEKWSASKSVKKSITTKLADLQAYATEVAKSAAADEIGGKGWSFGAGSLQAGKTEDFGFDDLKTKVSKPAAAK